MAKFWFTIIASCAQDKIIVNQTYSSYGIYQLTFSICIYVYIYLINLVEHSAMKWWWDTLCSSPLPMTKSEHFWHILHHHGFYSRADSNAAHMVHSDDVYFDKPGEKLSGEILGHSRWAKIGLWNDNVTYSAAALFQWPKVSIFGIFCTYKGSIKEQILMQCIWYILMMFIW